MNEKKSNAEDEITSIRVTKESLAYLNDLKKKGRFSSMNQLMCFFMYVVETRMKSEFLSIVNEYFERIEYSEEEDKEEAELKKHELQDPTPVEEMMDNLGGRITPDDTDRF
ncbi:MAG: hypothetical protein ACTSRU_00565 [Candidatus Hodarchaeales archaeon]